MEFTRITIIRARKPTKHNINEDLQWFGGSLGLFNPRDRDKSCFRIFITLIKHMKAGQGLTSDAIAAQLNLSRGTVVHHLTKLMASGIVDVDKNRYVLKFESMKELVDIIQSNLNKTFQSLHEVGDNIDKRLGL